MRVSLARRPHGGRFDAPTPFSSMKKGGTEKHTKGSGYTNTLFTIPNKSGIQTHFPRKGGFLVAARAGQQRLPSIKQTDISILHRHVRHTPFHSPRRTKRSLITLYHHHHQHTRASNSEASDSPIQSPISPSYPQMATDVRHPPQKLGTWGSPAHQRFSQGMPPVFGSLVVCISRGGRSISRPPSECSDLRACLSYPDCPRHSERS